MGGVGDLRQQPAEALIHGDIRVLNGGFKAWVETGLPVTKEIPPPEKGDFEVGDPLERVFTKEKIEDVLKTLCETDDYGTILRAKGMVEDENGTWIYFDMVPGEYELRDGEPDYTGRLCVIGCNIDEHRLEELFGI